MRNQKGSSVITTPIIIAIGMMLVSTLIVASVRIIAPYIWYEKLSSTCMKYVFVMEEYGYLTQKEVKLLLSDLEKQGFNKNNISLDYTAKHVDYGEEIFLHIDYDYELNMPIAGKLRVPMKIEKFSICKR